MNYFHLKALGVAGFLTLAACNGGSEGNSQSSATSTSLVAASSSPSLNARNLPAENKILFVMGQDTETLDAFNKELLQKDPQFPRPGGVTLYTKISHDLKYGSLAGLTSDVDYGSGRNNFDETLAEFPGAALAVGLDITDAHLQCKSIPTRAISGEVGPDVTPALVDFYRQEVDKIINYLKNADRQIFLRIGYEYDGPWNCYDPETYKTAFQYIKQRIDALDAKKIATVWQSAAWLRDQGIYKVTDPGHLDKFYPGDAAVDYVSISKFYGSHYRDHQWSCDSLNPDWFTPMVSPESQQDRVLDFARAHHKPVMIAEASPAGFDTANLTSSCIFTNRQTPITADELWNSWYQDWFDYILKNRDVIRVAAYINTHWHSQAMWYCEPNALAGADNCKQSYWGDARIEANPEILAKFKAELLNPAFVQSK